MDSSSRATGNEKFVERGNTLPPFKTLLQTYLKEDRTMDVHELVAANIAARKKTILRHWIPHYVKDSEKASRLTEIVAADYGTLCLKFEECWDRFGQIVKYVEANFGLDLVKKKRRSLELEGLVRSWSLDYEDPNEVLPYVYHTLVNMCSSWDPDEYYYPGTTAVQTSGAGKSKTFCSLTKYGVYVVYCSFLSETSSGYPKRSLIANFITGHSNIEPFEAQLSFLAYIVASVDAVTACYDTNIDPATFLQVQISESDGDTTDLALTEWILSRHNHHKDILVAFTSAQELVAYVNARLGLAAEQEGMHTPRPRDFIVESFPIKPSSDKPSSLSKDLEILFVMDEARGLLENICTQRTLHPVEQDLILIERERSGTSKLAEHQAISSPLVTCMHRAFRWIPKYSRIFAVSLDTTSRISDLAPPTHLDHSERFVGQGRQLYRPIYLLATLDIRNPFQHEVNKEVDLAMDPQILFQYGRPLWFTTLSTEGVERTVSLASSKLLGGGGKYFVMTSDPSFQLSQLESLSLLRTRFPFHVCRSDISSELVAGHLSWCVYISDDRYIMTSTMPSEPIMAEAAAAMMAYPKHYLDMVRHFAESMSSGVIDPGQGGQVVAKLLLTRARDHAALHLQSINPIRYAYMSCPIKLRMFMDRLLGHSFVDVVSSQASKLARRCNLINVVESGVVAFSHFCCVDRLPTENELLMLYARGAALVIPRGQKEADLVIIYLLPNAEGNYILNPENIGIMVVEIKNWKASEDAHYPASSTMSLIGLERVPRHMYLSFYMGLDGIPDCGIPEQPLVQIDPEDLQEIRNKLKDYLVRPSSQHVYEAQLASLRMGELTAQELEVIRRDRQIAFSALGLSSAVYPCLKEFTQETFTRDCRVVADNIQFPQKQWVKIWHGKRCPEESQHTAEFLFQLNRILQSFPYPAAYNSDPADKELIKQIAIPQYLQGFHTPANDVMKEADVDEALEILVEATIEVESS